MEPQIEMNREKVKTVGFSLLAQSGQFSLEIDYIKAINTEETEGKGVYANIQLAKRNCFITIHTLKKIIIQVIGLAYQSQRKRKRKRRLKLKLRHDTVFENSTGSFPIVRKL